jgi:ribA/ribD-fused uncharacterized protein
LEHFTFFWHSDSPFSHWYHAEFILDGIRFCCAEQAMMYQKAILFQDHVIAKQILKSVNPKNQKALGRKVRHFRDEVWNKEAKGIVYKINHAKFTQNPALLAKLLDTKGTLLAEASPYDHIWGIGLDASHPHAKICAKWLGKNWLGEVLTQLREDLLNRRLD